MSPGSQPHSHLDSELLPRTQPLGHRDAELLLPAEFQGVCVLVREELQRHDAHSHQLVLVQLLKALGDDCAYTLSETEKRSERQKAGPAPGGGDVSLRGET